MTTSDEKTQIAILIEPWRDQGTALLTVLHAIQGELGYISDTAIPIIAGVLNISEAEVFGVVSFYHDFRQTPPAKHRIKVCRAESCQACGGRELEAEIKQQLDVDYHQISADQRFSLEPVYCFGNCACSPAISIDDQLYGRLEVEDATILMIKLKDGVSL